MARVHLSKAVATDVEEQLVLDAFRSGWIAPLAASAMPVVYMHRR